MTQPPMVPPQQPTGPGYNTYVPPAAPPQYAGPPQQYGGAVQPYGGAMQPAVAPKNPGIALLASFFIPGLGSLINGRVGMGIAIFVAYSVAWVLTLVIIGFVLLPAVWVWGMYDAYSSAKSWNAAHGILS